MNIVALVMAGGKGKRLGLTEEKPLVRIHGKPMIHYVIETLKKSKYVDRIVVVTTKNTKKTSNEVKKLSVMVEEAPGRDYISDIQYVAKKLGLSCIFLVVSADLPCITNNLIDDIIEHFKASDKPALCVTISSKAYKSMGLKPSYIFMFNEKDVVPVGINVIKSDKINKPKIEEEVLILTSDKVKFVVNVNTKEELIIATEILAKNSSQTYLHYSLFNK